MLHDLRLALRACLRRPASSAAVVITLAVALGATTAIVSLVYALILRPLPFPDADRLVQIDPVIARDAGRLSLREYRDLAQDSRTLDRWAAYYRSQYNLTGGGSPEALTCTIGTSTLFVALGVQPVHGDIWPQSQDFTRQYQVVLSHRLWQQRFAGRLDAVGSTLVMDGGTYRVAGVLPEGVDYPLRTDIFRAITDYNAPHVRRYSALARLKPGVTIAQAQAELDAIARRFEATWPDTNTGVTLRATPLRDAYVGRARPFLWLLLGAVGLLLVIACVNVTNLLLSRAMASGGDAAVRLALGASRGHLIRQALAEALVLTLTGAVCGALGARVALGWLTSMVQADLPPWFDVRFDPVVLLWSTAIAIVTAAAVASLPAGHAFNTDVEPVLRQSSTRTAGSRGEQQARRWLLGGQAAFATLLLVSAGLFAGALGTLLRIDPGFEPEQVMTFRVDPPWGRYPDIPTTTEFYRRAAEALERIPGVEAAGANMFLPFSGLDLASPRVSIEGRSSGRADEEPFVNFQVIDPGYLRAMRIPLLRGRAFTHTDDMDAPPVAIVSARTAQRFWPDADPIGRRFRVLWNQHGTGGSGGTEILLTVIGVAGNVRFSGVDDTTGLDVYAPNMQLFAGESFFVVRARSDAEALRRQIRHAIDTVDRDQSVFDVQTMTARVRGSFWQHRVATAVLGVFALVAWTLAVIGTYAVTAQAVASQRREIGIRLALGSSRADAGWLVMRRWLTPIAVGIITGLAGGGLIARMLADALGVTGLSGISLIALAGAPAALALAAVIACYVPVRHVMMRVQLVDALRAE
jgi:putative ABC transport system permease protein